MALTDTKAKRLGIMLGIVAAFVVIQFSVAVIGGNRARAAAKDLAPKVEAKLANLDRDEVNLLWAKEHAAAYAGQSLDPFQVAGKQPRIINGKDGSFVLSYQQSRWASRSCVEARWGGKGRPRIWVNDCTD